MVLRRDEVRGLSELPTTTEVTTLITNLIALTIAGLNPNATPTAIDPDDAGVIGSGPRYAYQDHAHEAITATAVDLVQLGASAEGSSGDLARADHAHGTLDMPNGLLPNGRFVSTGNDSARAAGVDTDMTVTVALTANRLYFITLYGEANLGAAGVAVAIECEHDGTVIGRFWRTGGGTNVAGNGPFMVNSVIPYVPAASDASATITVSNAAASGASLTMHSNHFRSLTVTDEGPV